MSNELLQQLLNAILVLFDSKNREIIKVAIGFIKVATGSIPLQVIEDLLELIVTSLCLWANDSKNRFRLKIRMIFERLCRRFGVNRIAAFLPDDQQHIVAKLRDRRHRVSHLIGFLI